MSATLIGFGIRPSLREGIGDPLLVGDDRAASAAPPATAGGAAMKQVHRRQAAGR